MRLDSHRLGVAPALLERVVTKEMVKLQGTTSGGRDYLTIERADWVRDGLEARLAIQYDGELSVADRAFHLRNLALMMRRMEALVVSYLRRRLPLGHDGKLWSPVPTLAQVLLARAWLRGTSKPGEPLSGQLSSILSDETESSGSPLSRSGPWQEWLNKTKSWHSQMREDLRDLVALPTELGARGMINSGDLVGAIIRMNDTGQADPVPDFSNRWPGSLDSIATAYDLAAYWNTKRSQIENVEFRQLRERTATISDRLRGRSIASHLERVDAIVSKTSEILKNKGVDNVQTWKKNLAEYKNRPPFNDEVEDLIFTFDDESTIPSGLPGRLAWLASRPAGPIEALNGLLQTGEKAVEVMRDHAKDIISDGGAGASLDTIKSIGKAIIGASNELIPSGGSA